MDKHAFLYETPIGRISIMDNGAAITNLCFEGKTISENHEVMETKLIKAAYKQLQEYFSGTRKYFDIPLDPKGTPFQLKVWKALQEIPYGQTRTYKEIACSIGNEKACRAVGMANNKNPIPILIPCHRVIGSNGKLIGYAGGVKVKQYLLELEK